MTFPKIEELRKEKEGWTQEKVAAKLGIPYTTYRSYEKGAREPNIEILIKLSDLYNVSIDYILDHEPKAAYITPTESEHIERYRDLDGYGQEAVDSVLNIEHRRCRENPQKTVKFLSAARSPTSQGTERLELTEEQIKKLENAPDKSYLF